MRRTFVMTVCDRPEYLVRTLGSLRSVRGWENWEVIFSVEPTGRLEQMLELLEPTTTFLKELTSVEVRVQPERQGVLKHPWVVFDELFGAGADYVLRSEDDLIHGADILEYHTWASERYRADQSVGFVTSFFYDFRDHSAVRKCLGFPSPLLIGTWPDRWFRHFRENWDFDYSTGDEFVEGSGWDFNLNYRVMPRRGLYTITPLHAKCEHIGVFGTHSTPGIFLKQPEFNVNVPAQTYHEVAV